MSKRILVISSSLRKNSNSDILAVEFARGAEEAGNDVSFVSLSGKNIGFCNGCLTCNETHRCHIRDDVPAIMEKAADSDILVFATPIYYYGMSGQLKTLLDRLNPLYGTDVRFTEVYLIATSAESGNRTADRTVAGVQGWIDCFEGVTLSDVIFAGGVNDPGEISDHPELMRKAYDTGRDI